MILHKSPVITYLLTKNNNLQYNIKWWQEKKQRAIYYPRQRSSNCKSY